MCGISGVYAFNDAGREYCNKVSTAVETMKQRGPDGQGIYTHNNVTLGHTRLAVIDTSDQAAQPFTDSSGRYTIVYNGEFYNFREYRKQLEEKGTRFISKSDTEVLLYLFIDEGPSCINKINGCFAFAIYDNVKDEMYVARDRMGINPLVYYHDRDKFIFASGLNTMNAYNIPKDTDPVSVYNYLQLNYIPAPYTIFKNVYKLIPGTYLKISKNSVTEYEYYKIPYDKEHLSDISYREACMKLADMLERSVKYRLISDVPLGVFLSGGLDSSIITALASKHVDKLNTFSIGYKDEQYFDETHYAEKVAKKYNTNHTVFSLSNNDLYDNLYKMLDSIDEPFADSSALAVHILSMHTRKNVTVALSGDGADEMFAGYNKYMAHYKASNPGIAKYPVMLGSGLWKKLPQSRNNKTGNFIRQLNRFSAGMKLSRKERYWRWCSFADESQALELLNIPFQQEEYEKRKAAILMHINKNSNISDILYTDMLNVLRNDMLVKVDLMSMANSLEVRTPFLDHNIVNFIFSLPDDYKISRGIRKKILQDAFAGILPKELYNRPKQGFEVPLLKWFRRELKTMITDDLLDDSFIIDQGIFNVDAVRSMKNKLFSRNPGDIHARIWGLIVFQYWCKKYML